MSLAEITEFLSYDRYIGRFDWIKRPKGAARWVPGTPAGCERGDGYRIITWQGRPYLAHHLAWWFVFGELPKRLDHRNRDPRDNRISNLRPCTQSQNMANSTFAGIKRTNRFRGVHAHARGGWSVSCGAKYVGYFQDERKAAEAYDEAARQRWGDFALTNFGERR